ncbi:hypothetical protein [Erythrobacter sp.]|uniref:hypothetical protein n=1 Tax=Erythrobacter sp. TaxID=1042 RepID=UPI0025E901E7|nr:hypothetical protein [Erythrobacter sp.]
MNGAIDGASVSPGLRDLAWIEVWRRAGALARRHVDQLEEEPDLPEPSELLEPLEEDGRPSLWPCWP